MCVPGGPKILLDSEPRAPAPPTVSPPAGPPRRGPRSGWRRASLHRGYLTVKNNPRPAWWCARRRQKADSLVTASTWIIRVDWARKLPTYGEGSRPMTSLAHRGFVHLGMDVSKDSISVAILHPDRDVAVTDKISSDPESLRRLIKRLGRASGIWACYEAGPTGYDLYRLLTSMKVRCDVVAPSLVPKGRGDRVKTDKRDSRRLAGLHRAGELSAIAVPNPEQEAVRDLCRTRGDMVEDLTRARNRLTKFLLRHSTIYRGGSNWTIRHERWLQDVHFEDKALAATFAHYRSTVQLRDTSLDAVEADLCGYFATDPFADAVARLGAYRGVTHMGGLCLGAEVFDWRRFPSARGFMGFTGLTCSENSTGLSERRGAITLAGNSHIRSALRGGVVLPASPGARSDHPRAPRRGQPGNHRALVGGPEPSVQALRNPCSTKERQIRRGHCSRPRARRLSVGRDGR